MSVLSNAKHERNRFYVYTLIDSRDDTVFYVGKGCGRRSEAHFLAWKRGAEKNPKKAIRISEIVADGGTVLTRVVHSGLTECEAYKAERALIAEIGLKNLTNLVKGLLSDAEKAALAAKDALEHHIIPFDQWMAKKPRTPQEIGWYHTVVSEFREMAARSA